METANEGIDEEVQMVTFMLGREHYGVDVMKVEGVVEPGEITRLPNAPPFILGITNLRGKVIGVIDLARRLGLEEDLEEKPEKMLVVESKGVKVGLLVSSPDVTMVSRELIEAPSAVVPEEKEPPFVSGIARIGDRLVVVLDVDAILEKGLLEAGEVEVKVEGEEGAGEGTAE